MTSRTLTDLRTGIRQLADIENAADFIDDTELTKYANEGLSDLYDVRVDACPKLFAVNGPLLAEGEGTYVWVLPTDFRQLISVHILSGGYFHPARPADITEYAELAANAPNETAARYFLRESFGTAVKELYLFPSGISATNIAYTYIPSPTLLSVATDAFAGSSDELEYIEVYGAIKCLNKEESDTTALDARLTELRKRIRNATKDSDLGAPRTIRRVRGLGYV